MKVPTLLSLTVAISAGRANVITYVAEVQSMRDVRGADLILEPEKLPDVQIPFLLERLTQNTGSLSIDLVVVREMAQCP
jgi:hypothetical protein